MSNIRNDAPVKVGSSEFRQHALRKARYMCYRYNDLRQLCQKQYKYPENTDRYNATMRWYDVLHDALYVWDSIYPKQAQVVRRYFGIYPCVRSSAVKIALDSYRSQASVYKTVQKFIDYVADYVSKEML